MQPAPPREAARENRPKFPVGGAPEPAPAAGSSGNAPKRRSAPEGSAAAEPRPPRPHNPERWQRWQRLGGLALLALGLYLLVSMVSHLFAGADDQSVAELGAVPVPSADAAAGNSAGTVGAWLANRLMTQGYGFIALLLPPYLLLLGYALLEDRYWGLLRRATPHVLFALHWTALLFGILTAVLGLNSLDWAGGLGLSLTAWLRAYLGLAGTALLAVALLFGYAIVQWNASLRSLGSLDGMWDVHGDVRRWFGRAAEAGTVPDDPAPEAVATRTAGSAAPDADPWDANGEDEDVDEAGHRLPVPPADVLEGGFVVSVRKAEDDLPPLPDLAAPAEGFAPLPRDLDPLRRAHQALGGTPVAPVGSGRAPQPGQRSPGEVEFVVEAPQPDLPAEPAAPALPTPPSADNIQQVAPHTYEKIVAAEDLPTLDEDEVVADWSAYDPTLELAHYQFPPIELLRHYESAAGLEVNRAELEANKTRIISTLANYNIEIVSIKATIGPTVTLYEIVPAPGVRISKIKGLEDDIALSLAALGIRIIAPMPGKGTIGIEIPNSKPETVSFRSLVGTEKFKHTEAALPIAVGKTISNEVFIADLAKMPHLLVAGATGQGKSVGLNCIIASLLYKKHPAQVKFVLIDPKKVEMTLYQLLAKHFLAKLPNYDEAIITDTRQAVHVLSSLCLEMDQRYDLLKQAGVRNIQEYNAKFQARRLSPRKGHRYLPYLVLVIDELADLMMTAGKEVEAPVIRLAQLGRAAGLHLIIATQRPSVNVITGIIKANFPARLSYRVISKVDSRTILDTNGADQLVGRGDALLSTGTELLRIQNAFVDTPEIEALAGFIAAQPGYHAPYLLPEVLTDESEDGAGDELESGEIDPLFEESARLIVRSQQGSTSLIQRKLAIGYNRAGRIMDQIERAGICGPAHGSKPRDVLIADEAELERIVARLRG